MKPFFRFIAAILCLAGMVAALLYYMGGKQMEYVAETTIENATLQNVMDHLSKPELVEKWALDLVELKPGDDAGELASQPNQADQAELTIKDDSGVVEMESQFLFASDTSLTVRTTNENFDVFSVWKLSEQNENVVVRQLMLGNHKGLGRFTGLFNRESQESTMQRDLERLKSFVETGKIPEDNPSGKIQPSSLLDPDESN